MSKDVGCESKYSASNLGDQKEEEYELICYKYELQVILIAE